MDQIIGLVSTSRSWFSEFTIASVGLLALFILNLHFHPNISEIPNIDFLGYTGRAVLLAIVSYFSGRLLLIGSGTYILILRFILITRERWKKFIDAWDFLVKTRNVEVVTAKTDRKSSFELFNTVREHPAMQDVRDKLNLRTLFIHSFLSLSFVAGLTLSPWFLLGLIIFPILMFERDFESAKFFDDVHTFYHWKDSEKKK